jgi:hypothetical protein
MPEVAAAEAGLPAWLKPFEEPAAEQAVPDKSLPEAPPAIEQSQPEAGGERLPSERPFTTQPASPQTGVEDHLAEIRGALLEEEKQAQAKKPGLIGRVTDGLRVTGALRSTGQLEQPAQKRTPTGSLDQPAKERPPSGPLPPPTPEIVNPALEAGVFLLAGSETNAEIDESHLLPAGPSARQHALPGEGAPSGEGAPAQPAGLPEAQPESTGLSEVRKSLDQPQPAPEESGWRKAVSRLLGKAPSESGTLLSDEEFEKRVDTGQLLAGAALFRDYRDQPPADEDWQESEADQVAPATELPFVESAVQPEPFAPPQFEQEALEPELLEEAVAEETPAAIDDRLVSLFLTGDAISPETAGVAPGAALPEAPPEGTPPATAAPEIAPPEELAAAGPAPSYRDLRSLALEQYEEPGARPAGAPAGDRAPGRRFSARQLAIVALLVLFNLVLVAVLACLAVYALLPAQFSLLQPAATATAPMAAPSPFRLVLPGGWPFNLQAGSFDDGQWNPSGPEWLWGTQIRRFVALPWTRQLEAAVRSTEAGEVVDLVMSNGDTLHYTIKSVLEVPVAQANELKVDHPALIIILANKDAPTRWVIIATPADQASSK